MFKICFEWRKKEKEELEEDENEGKISVNSVKFDFGPSKIFVGDG